MTEEELRVLAWTILGEAGGEGTAGMQAVAHVIRNRALSGRFPSNPASVALQANSRGIHQFSTWNAITQGGNIPRARYPVGSAAFNKAMEVASRVFGPMPGKDPTQGATHYYAPQGMAGGNEPYWWKSEAPQGGKKIGNHIFALKRPEAVAPSPARRTAMSEAGAFPSSGQLAVFRSGLPAQLPPIGVKGGPQLSKKAAPTPRPRSERPSARSAPVPATQSLAMQIRRENEGATVRSSTTLIYDPVSRALVKPMPSAAKVMREVPRVTPGQSIIERAPARVVQRVAGFSVPGGVDGIREMETSRSVSKTSASDKVRAAKTLPKTRAQTVFAPNIAQPNGSVNPNKGQERLGAGTGLEPRVTIPSGGLSRDAVAAAAAGKEAAAKINWTKMPPMPVARPARPPVPVVVPPQQDNILRVVVQRDPVAETIRTPAAPISVVQSIKNEGYTAAQAYDLANMRERERAEAGATKGHSVSGGRQYDPDTGSWR